MQQRKSKGVATHKALATMALLCAIGATDAKASSAADFQAECEQRLAPSQITVVVDAPAVEFDYSKTTRELTHKKNPGKNWTTLGLTAVREEVGLNSSSSSLQDPSGRTCMRPSFSVTIKLNPQRVYVAREFSAGTCAFKEVRAHEMRHVAANQSHSEQVARAFEQEMRSAFGNDIYYATGAQGNALAAAVKVGWLPHLQEELKKSELLHAEIDTPAEYARMGTLCNGEVGKVLGSQKMSM